MMQYARGRRAWGSKGRGEASYGLDFLEDGEDGGTEGDGGDLACIVVEKG